MTAATNMQRPCDCTCRCGDDPAIAKGLAARCERARQLDRERAEISERMALQPVLALEAALARCKRAGFSKHRPGHEWFSLAFATPELAQAARYLVLTRQAEPHPTVPHLVRMTPTPRSAL